MLVALWPRSTPWMARLAKLGPLAYGIYLSHLLFIKILESLAARGGEAVHPTRLSMVLLRAGAKQVDVLTLARAMLS